MCSDTWEKARNTRMAAPRIGMQDAAGLRIVEFIDGSRNELFQVSPKQLIG